MEENNGDDTLNRSSEYEDSVGDTSFVTKVRTRMSGLFNSSLSRLFGGPEKQARKREDEDGPETQQPPRKRAKNDETTLVHNNSNFLQNCNRSTASLKTSSLSTAVYDSFLGSVAGPSGYSSKPPDGIFNSTPFNRTTNYDETSGYLTMTRPQRQRELQKSTKSKLDVQVEEDEVVTEPKSIVGSKRPRNITTETPNRSLFSPASLGLSPSPKHASLSSRKPSFNTSSFCSPNFVDRTITTSKIVNSPFYNGPTIYGGASAYGRQLGALDETLRRHQDRARNSIQVAPVNRMKNDSTSSLSKTARKILHTLEQYSKPVLSDAKKIPPPTRVEKKEGLLTRYVGANPYRTREPKVASNTELLIPTVPDLLKEKMRMQASTDKLRQIVKSSSTVKDDTYKIEETQQKHTNKMKSKLTNVRNKAATPAVRILDDVVLNPVPLSLPNDKLPKFDLTVPPPDSSTKINITKGETTNKIEKIETKTKPERNATNDSKMEFTFSKPLVIADGRNIKTIVAINNFKFSEPLCEKTTKLEQPPVAIPKLNNAIDKPNVKDTTLMEKFKPAAGTWECSTCLIRNKPDASKCIACETLRETEQKPKSTEAMEKSQNLAALFLKKPDEWECQSCLVRNKNRSERCIACSASKVPSQKPNGFGDKFKLSNDQWECETCLVRNQKDATKCLACETARRVQGFGDKFKPAADTWECSTCLIRNKMDATKCVACETKRTIGDTKWRCETCLVRNAIGSDTCESCRTPKNKQSTSFALTTAKSGGKWECPTCMVRNDDAVNQCPCCETAKPGGQNKPTLIGKETVSMFNFGVNKTQFNFGIPKEQPTTEKKVDAAFSATPSSASTFTFGVQPSIAKPTAPLDTNVTTEIPPPKQNGIDFKFGATPAVISTSPPTIPTATFKNDIKSSAPTFAFNVDAAKPTATPTFGLDAAKPSPSTNPAFNINVTKPADVVSSMPSQALFTFGKPEPEPTPSKAMFNFGPAAPSSAPVFNFTAPPDKAPTIKPPEVAAPPMMNNSVNNVFSFGAPAKTPSSGFQFAAPNGGGGGAPAPTNGGFNFGAATNNSTAAVFTFGAGNATAAPPSNAGFNFSLPSAGFQAAAPPTFDAVAKPTFNFTGGAIPTFSATPSEGTATAPVRKFKKAVRRAAQR